MAYFLNHREQRRDKHQNRLWLISIASICVALNIFYSHRFGAFYNILSMISFIGFVITFIWPIDYTTANSTAWWSRIYPEKIKPMMIGLTAIIILFTLKSQYIGFHFDHYGVNVESKVIETGRSIFYKRRKNYAVIEYTYNSKIYKHEIRLERQKYTEGEKLLIRISSEDPHLVRI